VCPAADEVGVKAAVMVVDVLVVAAVNTAVAFIEGPVNQDIVRRQNRQPVKILLEHRIGGNLHGFGRFVLKFSQTAVRRCAVPETLVFSHVGRLQGIERRLFRAVAAGQVLDRVRLAGIVGNDADRLAFPVIMAVVMFPFNRGMFAGHSRIGQPVQQGPKRKFVGCGAAAQKVPARGVFIEVKIPQRPLVKEISPGMLRVRLPVGMGSPIAVGVKGAASIANQLIEVGL
jgi:hypothetical protein